uniref:Tail spike protein n=1 Tax=Acinetobacter phage vB_Ab_164_KEN_02 TaxID=3143016 RepID=A0AAU8KV66_9VIRU
MNILRSFTETVVTTPTDTFPISFEYDEKYDAVHVFLNAVAVEDLGYTVSQVNAVTLKIEPAIPEGTVRIERETDIDKMKYIFDAGALFIDQNVDADFRQIVHSQQEVRDGFIKLRGDVLPLVHGLQEALKQAQEALKQAQEASQSAQEAAEAAAEAAANVTQGIITISSVAALRNTAPRTVYAVIDVLDHSDNGSGLIRYRWIPDITDEDDNGKFIKVSTISEGRWVAQYNGYITPKHYGARGDGTTDDRLPCEASIHRASVDGLVWLVPTKDNYYLNSYTTYAPLQPNYSARILPLLSNTIYAIYGKLSIGTFFDGLDFFVFTDIHQPDDIHTELVYNWHIVGTGVIDFSKSGIRGAVYKNRQGVYSRVSVGVSVEGITFLDGDLPNCITTPIWGSDFIIRKCKFKNLMSSDIHNDDHSTVYGTARSTHVIDCEFEMSTLNGKLNACAVELHNSDSTFKDSIIKDYRATHILAAFSTETAYISNIEVCGLRSKIYRNFSILDVWTGATLTDCKVHDNINIVQPFPSDAELIAAGFVPNNVKGAAAFLYTTNDSAIGFDLVQGECYGVEYYNNRHVSLSGNNLASEFKSAIYVYKPIGLGVKLRDNYFSVSRIYESSAGVHDHMSRYNIHDFSFDYSNILDVSKLDRELVFNLWVGKINNSSINIKFDAPINLNRVANLYVADVPNSGNVELAVHEHNSQSIVSAFDVTPALASKSDVYLSYPANVTVHVPNASIGMSDFYMPNIKFGKLLDRGTLPTSMTVGDYVYTGDANSQLRAISTNTSNSTGDYTVRLYLTNRR